MRRIVLSSVLAVAAVAGPGIVELRVAAAADATVTFTDRANPATLTVAPGTRVTFANQSGSRRRVRSEDGPADFDSGNIEPGASWSVVLDVPGTYPYMDERDDDPAYSGTVTVGPATPPPGSSPAPGPSTPPPGSPASPAPATASVAILDRSFSPATVTVAPGGTVSWANQSDRDHTVTGAGFDSGVLGGGGRFSFTFPSPGTFGYICELHPEMQASVTVTGGPGAAEPAPPPTSPAPAPAGPAPGPAAAAPQPPTTPAAARHDVSLVDYAFRPATLSVRVGDTVVWTNQGRAPHTATAAGAFDTGFFRAGEQRTTTLRTAGTFTFACTVHPEMTGVLSVAPAPGRSAPTPAPGSPPPASRPSVTAMATGDPAPAAAPDALLTPGGPGAEEAEVSVVDFAFEAATVRIAAGGTVTWTQKGSAPHTVTALDSSFDSGLLGPGGSFSHRFDQAGTYRYVCALHPEMVGTIEAIDGSSVPVGATAGDDFTLEQAAAPLTGEGGEPLGGAALLAALLGGAAILGGTGALLYGGSRMMAAGDRR